ncbi:MAG: NPCBM/NEW2 domain-containing protein [Pseudoxanthomonas sp.]
MAKTEAGPPSFRRWTDRLHAMGFKAGIYTDVGYNACSQAHDPGSPNLPTGALAEREIGLAGFEYGDLKTVFQEWGFDYVKVDACGLADFGRDRASVAAGQYRESRPLIVRGDAVRTDAEKVETMYARVGRLLSELNPDDDFVFSICPWGEAGVRDWGGRHGNLWRTSEDIEPTWESMIRNFDSVSRRELYAGPGRWNDPDMLAVGLGEFDADHLVEARTHFSLWAMVAAPLLMGFDLNHAPASLIELLSNQEVIAVDQDAAGNQGHLVADDGRVQVLVKPLATRGERAVLLLNRGDEPVEAVVGAKQMKLSADVPIHARDLWQARDVPLDAGSLKFALEPHGSVMLKVAGTPASGTATSLGDMTGRIHVAVDGLPIYSAKPAEVSGTPRADATPYGKRLQIAGTSYEYGIGAHANSRLEVLTGRQFARFSVMAGVDDSADAPADKVTFKVYGDGKPLYESAPLSRGDRPVRIDVPVTDVDVLELVAVAADREKARLPPVVAWADAELR